MPQSHVVSLGMTMLLEHFQDGWFPLVPDRYGWTMLDVMEMKKT